ncbi:zinc ribbon domain-containing protein [Okeania sp. SIO2B3]|uniref:zinc ribbon domain-containing protein n=1 Tax=Okeania sp. SIO2B3 TaxID=2607784 RepID=UPI0035C8E382
MWNQSLAQCEKYGREFRVIDRWEPTSQKCSCCGFKGGKKELNVRQWTCLNCGAKHDRDINAAINILNTSVETVVETAPQPKNKVEETVELENPIQLSLFVSVAPPQEAIVAGSTPRH